MPLEVTQGLPTVGLSPTAQAERNLEIADTPFTDDVGTGGYNEYLGMNNAGSNAPGIGIQTGAQIALTVADLTADKWTEDSQGVRVFDPTDPRGASRVQTPAPRTAQSTQLLGGIDAAEDPDPTTNPQTPALLPVNVFVDGATPLITGTANMVVADTAAAPGAILDSATGALNGTGETSVVGAVYWGNVPA